MPDGKALFFDDDEDREEFLEKQKKEQKALAEQAQILKLFILS